MNFTANRYHLAKVYIMFSLFTYACFIASYLAIRYWRTELFPVENSNSPVLRFILRILGSSIMINNLFAWMAIPVLIFKFYKQGSFLFTLFCFVAIALITVWFCIAIADLAP